MNTTIRTYFENNTSQPLPKFGEWDVNNPAAAARFSAVFNRARDEKKARDSPATDILPRRKDNGYDKYEKYERYETYGPPKRKWFCCG
ncbi:hypothetical protein NMG60_11004568 [Bertholletia excelsa]